jgi:hypothetical protein
LNFEWTGKANGTNILAGKVLWNGVVVLNLTIIDGKTKN